MTRYRNSSVPVGSVPPAISSRAASPGASVPGAFFQNSSSRATRRARAPVRSPLELGEFAQALVDVACVISAFLLVSVTSLAIVGSLFVLFFVAL